MPRTDGRSVAVGGRWSAAGSGPEVEFGLDLELDLGPRAQRRPSTSRGSFEHIDVLATIDDRQLDARPPPRHRDVVEEHFLFPDRQHELTYLKMGGQSSYPAVEVKG